MTAKTNALRRLQSDRLEVINRDMKKWELPTLLRTGTYQNGETELVSIEDVRANKYYAIVEYTAILPDGSRRQFFIQYGKGTDKALPAIIIVVLNNRLVFVRSHRPALLVDPNSWVNELPRGFVVSGLEPTLLDHKLRAMLPPEMREHDGTSTVMGVLGRKLVPLLNRSDVHVDSFQPLNKLEGEVGLPRQAAVYEDTGRTADADHYWLLNLRTDDPDRIAYEARGPRQMELRFLTLREAWAERRKNDIRDKATFTGLLLYLDATGRINLD